MEFVLINAALYIALFLWYWRKHHTIDCGFLLIGIWSFVAIMGVFLYMSEPYTWDVTLPPFLFLFIAFLLFSRMFVFPLKNADLAIESFVYKQNRIFDALCILFIFCAFINLVTMDFNMSALTDAETVADELYDKAVGSASKKAYSNIIQRFTMNYTSWFGTAALIGMFSAMCQKRRSLAVLLAIAIYVPGFFSAVMRGSRSMIFSIIMMFISCYFFYKKYIPKSTKKTIYKIVVFWGSFVVLYLVGVTIARFGRGGDAGDSLLSYFGQSMLNYNFGLADSFDGTYHGARTFKNVLGWVGIPAPVYSSDLLFGTHFGTDFVTFIGMLLLDFDYIGTIILAIILPWIIKKFCFNKSAFSIAKLYLYLFFLNRLIFGVFVNGSGADLPYIVAFLFYFVFLFLFRDNNGKKISTTKA